MNCLHAELCRVCGDGERDLDRIGIDSREGLLGWHGKAGEVGRWGYGEVRGFLVELHASRFILHLPWY